MVVVVVVDVDEVLLAGALNRGLEVDSVTRGALTVVVVDGEAVVDCALGFEHRTFLV